MIKQFFEYEVNDCFSTAWIWRPLYAYFSIIDISENCTYLCELVVLSPVTVTGICFILYTFCTTVTYFGSFGDAS